MLFTFCGKYLLHVYALCTCLLVKPHKLSFMFSLLMSVKELMIVTSTLTALTLMAHTTVTVPVIQDIVAMEETAVSTLLI